MEEEHRNYNHDDRKRHANVSVCEDPLMKKTSLQGEDDDDSSHPTPATRISSSGLFTSSSSLTWSHDGEIPARPLHCRIKQEENVVDTQERIKDNCKEPPTHLTKQQQQQDDGDEYHHHPYQRFKRDQDNDNVYENKQTNDMFKRPKEEQDEFNIVPEQGQEQVEQEEKKQEEEEEEEMEKIKIVQDGVSYFDVTKSESTSDFPLETTPSPKEKVKQEQEEKDEAIQEQHEHDCNQQCIENEETVEQEQNGAEPTKMAIKVKGESQASLERTNDTRAKVKQEETNLPPHNTTVDAVQDTVEYSDHDNRCDKEFTLNHDENIKSDVDHRDKDAETKNEFRAHVKEEYGETGNDADKDDEASVLAQKHFTKSEFLHHEQDVEMNNDSRHHVKEEYAESESDALNNDTQVSTDHERTINNVEVRIKEEDTDDLDVCTNGEPLQSEEPQQQHEQGHLQEQQQEQPQQQEPEQPQQQEPEQPQQQEPEQPQERDVEQEVEQEHPQEQFEEEMPPQEQEQPQEQEEELPQQVPLDPAFVTLLNTTREQVTARKAAPFLKSLTRLNDEFLTTADEGEYTNERNRASFCDEWDGLPLLFLALSIFHKNKGVVIAVLDLLMGLVFDDKEERKDRIKQLGAIPICANIMTEFPRNLTIQSCAMGLLMNLTFRFDESFLKEMHTANIPQLVTAAMNKWPNDETLHFHATGLLYNFCVFWVSTASYYDPTERLTILRDYYFLEGCGIHEALERSLARFGHNEEIVNYGTTVLNNLPQDDQQQKQEPRKKKRRSK